MFEIIIIRKLKGMRTKWNYLFLSPAYVADHLFCEYTDQHCFLILGDLLKYLMENEGCIHLCIVAFSVEVKTNKIILTGLFNNQAYHSPSLTLSILDDILLRTIAGSNASLTVSNKPQPYPRQKKQKAMYVILFIKIWYFKCISPTLYDYI